MTDKSDKVECEIFIGMNEDGDWVVRTEEGDVLSELIDMYASNTARVVKIVAKMTPPVRAEAEVDVPDEAGTTEPIDAEAA